MGVPKFAAWLTKKYPAMVIDRCPADVHGLYIDLNGLIHPCCHDEHDATVALRTEVEKMRSICLAIETLVVTVKPQHIIYIAIDGVAPRAKMNQQRARRYMSAGAPLTNTEKPIHGSGGHEISAGVVAAIEQEFTTAERSGAEKELEKVNQALMEDVLYGGGGGEQDNPPPTPSPTPAAVLPSGKDSVSPPPAPAPSAPPADRFDSNCISPGTAFMDNVAATVRDFVRHKLTAAEVTPPSSSSPSSGGALEGRDPPSSHPAAAAAMGAPAAASPWANLTVVFSDSNTAGEGEHKFLDFLRTQSAFPGFNGSGCHVIAGLDADLIFLSLSLHIPRVVILRDHDRSSYEQALLPVSAGGTLVTDRKGVGVTATSAASDSTSSIGSAAAVTPSSRREGEVEEGNSSEDVYAAATTVVDGSDGRDSAAATTNASPASPPASLVSPIPHIASVVAEVCTTYEYYDMDVVGSSLVSEIYQLCLEKGMVVHGNPLENLANCVASNGFDFLHGVHAGGSGGGGGEVEGKKKKTADAAPGTAGKENTKAKASSSPSAPPPPLPPPPFHPCTSTSNSKIIDDFIVLGMLLGNDFLPHSPSVYCGESAMDTLLDVYVSAVLPYGYLTGGLYEIQLLQLERLLRAYAAVEATRFRQYAIQAGCMTPQEAAAAELCTAADRRCWRDPYIRTTSLKDDAGVAAACRAYVEGLRFVWRYYSSISLQVSWSWYYPFHHAPFALDVADFLRAQGPNVQATLPAPKLERLPPSPFCQLLCILPPTSRLLVPAVLRPAMVTPPPALADTFPRNWTVDFTGAYGKDHLAAVLLPFANLPDLQQLVQTHAVDYAAGEKARNALRSTHLVLQSHGRTSADPTVESSAPAATPAAAAGEAEVKTEAKDASKKEKEIAKPKRTGGAAAAANKARGFWIQGDGLQPLPSAEVPPELQNAASITCFSMADGTPPLSRPRTYSYTVPIPNLTVLPDGTRVPAERRPQSRYGSRRRHGNGNAEEKGKEKNAAAVAAAANAHAAKPAMLFGEFMMALAVAGLLAATAVSFRGGSLLGSFLLLLQLCGVACAVLGVSFALGLAVASKGRTAGSGMHRHSIFTAFADWQCASCLSLNFSRNRRCFICRAPFDPHRCTALFSGRNPPEPPLMDPDHAAYAASYGIVSL